MKLPSMRCADRIVKGKQLKFAGLNHTMGAGDGDLWDMENMTGDHFPLLASRAPRYLYRTLDDPGGIFCWNKLCWVDGTDFYYDGEVKGQVTAGKKTFAAIDAYVVILPDKCCYNVETGVFSSMESHWSGESLTFGDGLLYGEKATANTVSCPGVNWADWFREGDAVTIGGCTVHPENNKTPIIRHIDGDKLYFYENIFTLEDDTEYTELGQLTLKRTVPDLLYVCENENRLWGCDGTTIYASKQGDIFNWNVYDGLESDAYAVSPGSAGLFTGCSAYKGFAIPFKEEHIYKIYGSTPSTYSVMGSASLGLADGSSGSLAVAGEILFYLSRSGIMAYSGGIPQPIGDAFGLERFKNAVGGSDGLKYYVSMEGEDGERWLYVYDTQRGFWHKEDRQDITHFAALGGKLYFLNTQGQIWIIGNDQDLPEGAVKEDAVEWMVEFADFTDENPNKKTVSKIQIRLELDEDAEAQAWIQYDSDGRWLPVSTPLGEDVKRSYYLPVTPRRCDHYRLKLTGKNGCRVYSLAREYSAGSELRSKHGRN